MENERATFRQMMAVMSVASPSAVYGLMLGWPAVLPRLQEDQTTHFNLTDQDVANLVSMISMVGILPSLLSGPLVECLGPRRLMLMSITPILGIWLMMAFTPYKSLLYVGRAGVAVGVALEEALVNPMVAELSPAAIRGMGGSIVSIGSSLGTLLAYLLARFTSFAVATSSRVFLLLLIVILICFIPESPYWLVRRGRVEAAHASLRRIHHTKSTADKELSAIIASPSSIQASVKNQFVELRKRQNSRPVLLVLILFVLRELGGRSAILQYSVYIFRNAGVDLDPFTCTVFLGLTRLLFSIISAVCIDRMGRRVMLLVTASGCGLVQGLAGIIMYFDFPGTSWVPLVALLLYVACYGLGLGPVFGLYIGELLPSPVRSIAVSIITVSYTLTIFAVNFAFLQLMKNISVSLTLLFMGIFNLLMIPLVIYWIPESTGVSLHELQVSFLNVRRK